MVKKEFSVFFSIVFEREFPMDTWIVVFMTQVTNVLFSIRTYLFYIERFQKIGTQKTMWMHGTQIRQHQLNSFCLKLEESMQFWSLPEVFSPLVFIHSIYLPGHTRCRPHKSSGNISPVQIANKLPLKTVQQEFFRPKNLFCHVEYKYDYTSLELFGQQ